MEMSVGEEWFGWWEGGIVILSGADNAMRGGRIGTPPEIAHCRGEY